MAENWKCVIYFALCQLYDSFYVDQWSPLNMEGKKLYDRDFLLQLQYAQKSTTKPKDLPDLPDIILENVSQQVIFETRPIFLR
jgi:translation initiation factor 4G